MFPNYSQMITDNCKFDKEHIHYLIQCYLQKLIEKFDEYFPNNEIGAEYCEFEIPIITGIIAIYHQPTITL